MPGKGCGILLVLFTELSLAGYSWSLGPSVGAEVVERVVCMMFLA